MSSAYLRHRQELLSARLARLNPSLERAAQAVHRLELEPVPAGAAAGARAARLSAARTMAATLGERARQLRAALAALQAEAAE